MDSELSIIVQKVALYLGPPWRFKHRYQSDWRFEVIGERGQKLIFLKDKDRFRILGAPPKGARHYHCAGYNPIGVNARRPPKDIAADITRRLLPGYFKAFENSLQRHKAEQAKEQTLEHIIRAFCKVTGGRKGYGGRSGRAVYFEDGEADFWGDKRIDLKLRDLTPEQAIKIAAYSQKLKAESRDTEP
jgi:hypothetical protein